MLGPPRDGNALANPPQRCVDLTVAPAPAPGIDYEDSALTLLGHAYTVRVRVRDGGGLGEDADARVDVVDVCEGPLWTAAAADRTFFTTEDAAEGDTVGTPLGAEELVADPDVDSGLVPGWLADKSPPEHDVLTFAIADGNDGTAFAIDEATGQLSVNSNADFTCEGKAANCKTWTLSVRVTDKCRPTGTSVVLHNVKVVIQNINHNPKFGAASYTFTWAEDTAVGTVVGEVAASDGDEDTQRLTYALSGFAQYGSVVLKTCEPQPPADGTPAADTKRCTLTLQRALDFETHERYALTAAVTDIPNNSGVPPLSGGIDAPLTKA